MAVQGKVLLVATMDTKAQEAGYLRKCLEEAGMSVMVLDAGIMGESPPAVDVPSDQVALAGGKSIGEVRSLGHEGKALEVMARGAVHKGLELHRDGRIRGVVGLGGSMGTTLGTAVMRALPIGFPKVMISTMASRNTRPFVGTKDILMLHSVCDLSGINRITRRVLRNGAMAVAGMVSGGGVESSPRPLMLLSTLGTTESCALRVRRRLEKEGYEVVTFHTVGAGGEALETMVQEEDAAAVVELSLHEIVDHLFGGEYDAGPDPHHILHRRGGEYDAGPDRGRAAPEKGIPFLWVPGNVDFLVGGPLETVQRKYPGRRYHVHNAAITVVRADEREVTMAGEAVAQRCGKARGPWAVLVPMKGLSAFDREGGPLFDPKGPELFVQALRSVLGDVSQVQTLPYHVNDPPFSEAVVENLHRLMRM